MFMFWLRACVYHIERCFFKYGLVERTSCFCIYKTGKRDCINLYLIVVQNVIHHGFGRLTVTVISFAIGHLFTKCFVFNKQAVSSWTVCGFRRTYFSVNMEVLCNVLIR